MGEGEEAGEAAGAEALRNATQNAPSPLSDVDAEELPVVGGRQPRVATRPPATRPTGVRIHSQAGADGPGDG